MERKKNLTLLWRRLNSQELGKDVILVPYYLGQALGCNVDICCGYPDNIAEQVINEEKEDLHFIRKSLGYKPLQRIPIYIKYLSQHARHIDILMCFHWRLETFANILLYKLLNRNGIVYIKLDTELGKEWDLSRSSPLSKLLRRKIYNFCLKQVNVLSCETSQAYNHIILNKDFKSSLEHKLFLMPNAFDEAHLQVLKIRERAYTQKENIMITVGRLGTPQKNTEMLLKAFEKTDFQNWKFYLIGPFEKEFGDNIKQFYKKYPEKKENIIFVGEINDKKELWEWYNRAKVFVFTSRWESYGLVLNEAKRFRNYLISTRVGAAEDLMEQGKYGIFIKQEDYIELSAILSKIIHGETEINVYQNFDVKQLSYKKIISVITKAISYKNITYKE